MQCFFLLFYILLLKKIKKNTEIYKNVMMINIYNLLNVFYQKMKQKLLVYAECLQVIPYFLL